MKSKSSGNDRRAGTLGASEAAAGPAAAGGEAAASDAPARIVRCPACGGDSLYAASNPSRPFCSERCRQRDFGAWASEEFRVPDPVPPDDQPFGDARLQ